MGEPTTTVVTRTLECLSPLGLTVIPLPTLTAVLATRTFYAALPRHHQKYLM